MDTSNSPDSTVVPSVPTETAPEPTASNIALEVVAAPAPEEDPENAGKNGAATPDKADSNDQKTVDAKIAKADKPPKTPLDKGVAAAITIAVVIICVLSVLAVLAYKSGVK